MVVDVGNRPRTQQPRESGRVFAVPVCVWQRSSCANLDYQQPDFVGGAQQCFRSSRGETGGGDQRQGTKCFLRARLGSGYETKLIEQKEGDTTIQHWRPGVLVQTTRDQSLQQATTGSSRMAWTSSYSCSRGQFSNLHILFLNDCTLPSRAIAKGQRGRDDDIKD